MRHFQSCFLSQLLQATIFTSALQDYLLPYHCLQYKKKYPLHFSSKHGSISDVSLLITDVNKLTAVDDFSRHPLFSAASAVRADMIQFLIDKGAEVDSRCFGGCTALHAASASAETDEDICIRFARDRAKLTSEETFCFACEKFQSVQILINNGAKLDTQDETGATALHHAAYTGGKATVFQLIQCGAKLDIRDVLHGDNPLHLAARMGKTESIEALLYKDRLLVNATNDEGKTALHLASSGGHRESVLMLINYGADCGAKANSYFLVGCMCYMLHDNTPLHLAAKMGHTECIEALLCKDRVHIDDRVRVET
jgi:ankyrin repeat protein